MRNALNTVERLAQMAAKQARCWEGYEPVPGKPAYSEDSCRPKGSKKKEKKAFDLSQPSTTAALGALLGGMGGLAVNPGEDEKGKPKSRVRNALLGTAAGGALGYGAGHGLNWLKRPQVPDRTEGLPGVANLPLNQVAKNPYPNMQVVPASAESVESELAPPFPPEPRVQAPLEPGRSLKETADVFDSPFQP